MNRQKERLQSHLEQILKDKEVIHSKIEALVSATERSVSAVLLIADAKKFRKEHAVTRAKIDNAVKVIDRLYDAFEEDEEGHDDDDGADVTVAFADQSSILNSSVAGTTVALNETVSDLIKLSSDGSAATSPSLSGRGRLPAPLLSLPSTSQPLADPAPAPLPSVAKPPPSPLPLSGPSASSRESTPLLHSSRTRPPEVPRKEAQSPLSAPSSQPVRDKDPPPDRLVNLHLPPKLGIGSPANATTSAAAAVAPTGSQKPPRRDCHPFEVDGANEGDAVQLAPSNRELLFSTPDLDSGQPHSPEVPDSSPSRQRSVSAASRLQDATLSPVDFDSLSTESSSGRPFKPISQLSQYDASAAVAGVSPAAAVVVAASPFDSRSSSRMSVHCVDNQQPVSTQLLFNATSHQSNLPFTSKYGPKKTKVPRAQSQQRYLPTARASATPQSYDSKTSIESRVDNAASSSAARNEQNVSPSPETSLPTKSPSPPSSSRPSLQHCVKSSFRLNVFDSLNRQFLCEAVKVEHRYVTLDRCVVPNVGSCDAFPAYLWVTVAGPPEEVVDLDHILDEVTKFYDETPPLPKIPVEESMVCAVRSSDGSWLRGKVNRVSLSTGEAEVALLDYGTFVVTPLSDILPLKARFVEYPCRTLPCRLRGIGPPVDQRRGNDFRDWKTFNERLQKAFDYWKPHNQFKLKAAFKYHQGLEEMFVDVRWPAMGGDLEGSFAEILIERGVGVAHNDGELIAAILSAKGKEKRCAIHGDAVGSVESFFSATVIERGKETTRQNLPPHERAQVGPPRESSSLDSDDVERRRGVVDRSPSVNAMRPRVVKNQSPPSKVAAVSAFAKHRFVKSLLCTAKELIFHPPKSSPSSGRRKIQFSFTWIESPEVFFITLHKNQTDVDNLTQAMGRFYRETPRHEYEAEFDPRVGEFVVVFCQNYDNFFRACIRDVRECHEADGQRGRQYHVYYVDYGNYEWRKLPDMAPLLEGFAYLPPQCVRCKPWPRLLPPKMSWTSDDVDKMCAMVDFDFVYSGRIGGDAPTAPPVSLAIESTDALELEVLLKDPEFEPTAGAEVILNEELVRRGIAMTGSPGRSSDSSFAPNSIEHARDPTPETSIPHSHLGSFPNSPPPLPSTDESALSQIRPLASKTADQPPVRSISRANDVVVNGEPPVQFDSAPRQLSKVEEESDSGRAGVKAENGGATNVVSTDDAVSNAIASPTKVTKIRSESVVFACITVSKGREDVVVVVDDRSNAASIGSPPIANTGNESAVAAPDQPLDVEARRDDDPGKDGGVVGRDAVSSALLLSSPNSSSACSSMALDSQPPNVVVAGGASPAPKSRNPSSVINRPMDNFLSLRAGEWYLCEVVSFVNPDNFFLRFPFGDAPLWDFPSQTEDGDAIFAIYPTTSTKTDPIRCLQKEIDQYCAEKVAAGEYLFVGDDPVHDDIREANGDATAENRRPLRVGARLLSRQVNGSFFRSVVRELDEEFVDVYLMDHGGCARVERRNRNFLAIPEDFDREPRMALRGRLASVRPKGGAWSLEAINWFIDQVTSKDLVANIISTKYDRLIVDLWDTSQDAGSDSAIDCSSQNAYGDVLINASIVSHGFAEELFNF